MAIALAQQIYQRIEYNLSRILALFRRISRPFWLLNSRSTADEVSGENLDNAFVKILGYIAYQIVVLLCIVCRNRRRLVSVQ